MKKKYSSKYLSFFLLLFAVFGAALSAPKPLYSQNITGSHRGNITGIIHNNDTVLTAGEDGFLVTWHISQRNAIDRFQLTTYRIQSMVKHPSKDELCIIETGGTGNYRISVWNYRQKRKLFSRYFSKPITYINYSATGNFIMAAGINDYSFTLLDSTSGETIQDPQITPGNTALALTNRTERSIMIYYSEHNDFSGGSIYTGQIIYFDLTSQSLLSSIPAPGNLSSPIVFGSNNNFLAGINHNGLQLIHATTGRVLDSKENISRNALLFAVNDEFFCVDQRGNSAILYRFSVNRNGNLVERQQVPLSFGEGTITAFANNNSLVFAASNGNIFHLGQQNRINTFNSVFQESITEIAIGEKTIAILLDDGRLSLLPIDYTLITASFVMEFKDHADYDRINYFPLPDEDHYILWQTDNIRFAPLLINTTINEGLKISDETRSLNILLGRFPFRSISISNTRLLTLDTRGNINVRVIETLLRPNPPARPEFTFSSAGANDAVFINNDNFIISRGVVNNSSPFLSVNTRTSETIPYFFPSQGGLMAYSVNNGTTIYGAAIEQTDILNTIFLNLSAPVQDRLQFRYHGEASNISIIESQGRMVILCDNEGIVIIGEQNRYFERTRGLPVKLFLSGNIFICLDSEGTISWHDNNGRLLAAFRLYENRWTLTTNREISGRLQ
jgi:hypothetical protein